MSPTSGKLEAKSDAQTTRSVILCGASVRSLAESAIAAGIHPLCVDFFEDADLRKLLTSGRGRFVRRIDSFQQIPEAIRSVRKSIPLLWAGGLENHTDILRDISQNRPVIGADLVSVDLLRDPWTIQRWLLEAGVNVPKLATEGSAHPGESWLRKSVASSGGLGIGQHATVQGASATPSPSVYLQEYIDGVPMSATFCADRSGLHLFGLSLQLIGWPSLGATAFWFCGNVGPVDPGGKVIKQVLAMTRVLVDRSGIRGVFGIDFILRQGEVWLLEVNPRLTASHMLYELKEPGLLVNQHLAALGWKPSRVRRTLKSQAPRLLESPSPVSARLILWAKDDISIPPNFGEPFYHAGSDPSPFRMADYPQSGSKVAKGSPLCSLHITASDFEDIEQHLVGLEAEPFDQPGRQMDELLTLGYSIAGIGSQLKLLRQKFESNCG